MLSIVSRASRFVSYLDLMLEEYVGTFRVNQASSLLYLSTYPALQMSS